MVFKIYGQMSLTVTSAVYWSKQSQASPDKRKGHITSTAGLAGVPRIFAAMILDYNYIHKG